MSAALIQFQYRSSANYYDAGDALTTNWWMHLNNWWNNYTIAWMGIAATTQLLMLLGMDLA